MELEMDTKIKKRRSFVDFRRKSLLFDEMLNEENDSCPSNESSLISKDKYMASLIEERSQWKNILKSKRIQQHQLQTSSKFDKMNIKGTEVEEFLSEEDKDFLNDEPDYLNMMECAKKYLKAVEFFKLYKSDLIHHYNKIVKDIETEIDIVVDHLCGSDICKLCNQKRCTDFSHIFPNF